MTMQRIGVYPRIPLQLLERPIAHRGLCGAPSVPENSLKAFEAGIRAGAPVELDVHQLADGTLVVFHDSDLQRMTGQSGKIGRQNRQSIRKLRLQNTEETIPFLSEVLDLIQGQVALLIELKSAHFRVGALEQAILKELQNYSGEFALQSFNPFTLRWFRRHAPSLCRGQLSGGWAGIPFAHTTCPDFVAYRIESMPCPAVTRAHQEGMAVLVWTVSTSVQEQKALQEADNYIFSQNALFNPYGSRNRPASF